MGNRTASKRGRDHAAALVYTRTNRSVSLGPTGVKNTAMRSAYRCGASLPGATKYCAYTVRTGSKRVVQSSTKSAPSGTEKSRRTGAGRARCGPRLYTRTASSVRVVTQVTSARRAVV